MTVEGRFTAMVLITGISHPVGEDENAFRYVAWQRMGLSMAQLAGGRAQRQPANWGGRCARGMPSQSDTADTWVPPEAVQFLLADRLR